MKLNDFDLKVLYILYKNGTLSTHEVQFKVETRFNLKYTYNRLCRSLRKLRWEGLVYSYNCEKGRKNHYLTLSSTVKIITFFDNQIRKDLGV